MPEYINQNSYVVHLPGPDGKIIHIKSNQKVILDSYFDRYCARGFIKPLAENKNMRTNQQNKQVQAKINLTAKPKEVQQKQHLQKQLVQAVPQIQPKSQPKQQPQHQNKSTRQVIDKAKKISRGSLVRRKGATARINKIENKQIVGRKLVIDATQLLHNNLKKNSFSISNNIGVGILSYNRKSSLKRLIDSIISNTDLRRTTIFISDDCSDDEETIQYLKNLKKSNNFVVITNDENIGIAGNSNRLLRCLKRFKFGLLLNDDVEVIKPGWDRFYSEATKHTKIHHFQYREHGIYGGKLGNLVNKGPFDIRVVDQRPQGAILSFTSKMIEKCGYFDEEYGKYGMEHVDWSMKPSEFGIQEIGFFDVEGSDGYFKIHDDTSSIDDTRNKLLQNAKVRFNGRQIRNKINLTNKSEVSGVSYVIPFRNIYRENSILTVINNIRAQKYPVIDINIIEQDDETNIDSNKFYPISHYLTEKCDINLFNKSKAFNFGVSKAACEQIVLHDADMLVLDDYTQRISGILDNHDGCHLGGTVIYTSEDTMNKINSTGVVGTNMPCERVVGYYEGGSLGCSKNAYWSVGGFNEDYWGYGCEDCDFYARLSKGSKKWKEDRSFDLLHLWHGRVEGWNSHHTDNKELERKLSAYPIQERIRMQRSQLQKLGYGEYLK